MRKRSTLAVFSFAVCIIMGMTFQKMPDIVHAQDSTLKMVDLKDGVTYGRDDNGNIQFVNLNGNSVIIEDVPVEEGDIVSYHNIYIDTNRNGIVDEGESKVELEDMGGADNSDIPVSIPIYGLYQAKSDTPIRITAKGSGYSRIIGVNEGELVTTEDTAIFIDLDTGSISSAVGALKSTVSSVRMSVKGTASDCAGAEESIVNASGAETAAIVMDIACSEQKCIYGARNSTITTSGTVSKAVDIHMTEGTVSSLYCAVACTVTAGGNAESGIGFEMTGGTVSGFYGVEGSSVIMEDSTKTALDVDIVQDAVVDGCIYGVRGNEADDAAGAVTGAVDFNVNCSERKESGANINACKLLGSYTALDGAVIVSMDNMSANTFMLAENNTIITGDISVVVEENTSILNFYGLQNSTAEKNVTVTFYGSQNSNSNNTANIVYGRAESKDYAVVGNLAVTQKAGRLNSLYCVNGGANVKGNVTVSILDGSLNSLTGVNNATVGGDLKLTTGETVAFTGGSITGCYGSVAGDYEMHIYNTNTTNATTLQSFSGTSEIGGNVIVQVQGGYYYSCDSSSSGTKIAGSYTFCIKDLKVSYNIRSISNLNVEKDTNVTIQGVTANTIYGCSNYGCSISGKLGITIAECNATECYGVQYGTYENGVDVITENNTFSTFYCLRDTEQVTGDITIQCTNDSVSQSGSGYYYGLYNGNATGNISISLTDCSYNYFRGVYSCNLIGNADMQITGGAYTTEFTPYSCYSSGGVCETIMVTADGTTFGNESAAWTLQAQTQGVTILTCDIKDTCNIKGDYSVNYYANSDSGMLFMIDDDRYYAGIYPVTEDVTAKNLYFQNGSKLKIPTGITVSVADEGMIYAKDGTEFLIEGTLKGAVCQDSNYLYSYYLINGGTLDTSTENVFLLYYPITLTYSDKGGTVTTSGTHQTSQCPDTIFGQVGQTVSAACKAKKGYTLTAATVKKPSNENPNDMAEDETTADKYGFDMTKETADIVITFTGNQLVLGKTVADPVAKLNEATTVDNPLYDMADVTVSNDGREGTVAYEVDETYGLPEGLEFAEGKIYGTPTVAYEEGKKTVIHVTGKNDSVADLTLNIVVTAGGSGQTSQDGRIRIDEESKEIQLLGNPVVIQENDTQTGIYLDDNMDGAADKDTPVYQGDLSEYTIYGLKNADVKKPVKITMKGGAVGAIYGSVDSEIAAADTDAVDIDIMGGIINDKVVAVDGSVITGTVALETASEAQCSSAVLDSNSSEYTGYCQNLKGYVTVGGTYTLRESVTVIKLNIAASAVCSVSEDVVLTANQTVVSGSAKLYNNGTLTSNSLETVYPSSQLYNNGKLVTANTTMRTTTMIQNKGSFSCTGDFTNYGKLVLWGGNIVQSDNDWSNVYYPVTLETDLKNTSISSSYFYTVTEDGKEYYFASAGSQCSVTYTNIAGYEGYYSVNDGELVKAEDGSFSFEMPREATALRVVYVPTDITLSKQFDNPVGVMETTYTEEKPLYDFTTVDIANDTTDAYGSNVRYSLKSGSSLPEGLALKNGKLIGTPKATNGQGEDITITVTGRNGTSADFVLTVRIAEYGYKDTDINNLVTQSGSVIDLHGHSVVIRAARSSDTKTSIYLDENQDGIADNSIAYAINGETELNLSNYRIYGCQYNAGESYNKDITIHMYGGKLYTLYGAFGTSENPVTVDGNVSVYIEGGTVTNQTGAGCYVEAGSLMLDITGGTFNGKIYGANAPQNVENVYFRFRELAKLSGTSRYSSGNGYLYVVSEGNVTGNVEAVIGTEYTPYGLGSYTNFYGVAGTKIAGDVNYTIDGERWYASTMNVFSYKSTVDGNINVDWRNGRVSCGSSNVSNCAFVRESSLKDLNVTVAEDADASGTINMAVASTVNNLYYYAPVSASRDISITLVSTNFQTEIEGYGYADNGGSIQIAGTYTIDKDLQANELKIAANAKVTIAEGVTVTNTAAGTISGTLCNKGTWNCNYATTLNGIVENEGSLNIERGKGNTSTANLLTIAEGAMIINRETGDCNIKYSVLSNGKIVNYGSLTQTASNATGTGVIYTTTIPIKMESSHSPIYYAVSLDYPEYCIDSVTLTDGSGNALSSSGVEGDTNQYLKEASAFKVTTGTVAENISLSTITYGSDNQAAVTSDHKIWTGTLGYAPIVITLNFDGTQQISLGKTNDTVTDARVGVKSTANNPLYDMTEIEVLNDTEITGGYVSYIVDSDTLLPDGLSLVNGKIYGTPTTAASEAQEVKIIVKGKNQTSATFILSFDTIAKGTPVLKKPAGLSAYAGTALSAVTLPSYVVPSESAGAYRWKDGTEQLGDVGGITKEFEAEFVPADTDNYDWTKVTNGTFVDGIVTTAISLEIKKAVPEYIVPENLTAKYGQTLKDVVLPEDGNGSFSWNSEESTEVGNVGPHTFYLTYTPDDTDKYSVVNDIKVTVTVQPAEITITPLDEVYAVYGDTLADIILPAVEGGKYQWITQSSVIPENGKSYRLGFKPDDIINYDWAAVDGYSNAYRCVIFDVTVVVDKIEIKLSGLPVELSVVYGKPLSDFDLPYIENGKWYLGEKEIEEPLVSADGIPDGAFEWTDGTIIVDTLEEMEVNVNFRPTEEEHYKTMENLKVKAAVSHTHVYEDGWKTDADCHWKECECGEKTEEAEHTWDEGVVTKEPTAAEAGERTLTCTVCEAVKIVEEPATGEEPHEHVFKDEWKTDTDCHWKECECGEKAEKAEHIWDEGVVTKQPAAVEDGEKTLTCIICKQKKTERIAATGEAGGTAPGGSENPGGGTSGEAANNGPAAGTVLSDSVTKAKYKVTGTEEGARTVMYMSSTNAAASTVSIPSTVTINNINYDVTAIADNAFKNNKKLKKVVISSKVLTIGNAAFSGCKKLAAVTMGENVTKIGKNAFYNCIALKKIVIPKNVAQIGSKAFYGCKKLLNITIKTTKLTTKTVGSKAFTKAGSSNYKKMTVKVPKSKLKVYKQMLKKRGLSSKAKIKK